MTLFDNYEFQVIGVYQTDSSFEKNNIIMMLDQLQKLDSEQGKITGCTVRLKPEVRKDDGAPQGNLPHDRRCFRRRVRIAKARSRPCAQTNTISSC